LKNPAFQYLNNDNVTAYAWSNLNNANYYQVVEDAIDSNETSLVAKFADNGTSVGLSQTVVINRDTAMPIRLSGISKVRI
jgi:hypothetical protein